MLSSISLQNLRKSICYYIVARRASTNSKNVLRFDGKTAIVTGAGRGLGREYALLLASRGANVVINDYDCSISGKSSSLIKGEKRAADLVVDEIKTLFPNANAVANYDSVSCEKGVKNIIETALGSFNDNKNKIDILINNAGILIDKSFIKMTIDDWDQVYNIHLRGSFLMTHACWPYMREQQYGRIVMTSSTSGLYGNFGQANYSAAKMGLIGLSNTLAIEGASKNIHCNTIVPIAASRMTEGLIPEELAKHLKPAYVAPLVVYLCHSNCKSNGSVIEAAGGWYGRNKLQRGVGKYLSTILNKTKTTSQDKLLVVNFEIEQLAENWDSIVNQFDSNSQIETFADHLGSLMKVFESKKGDS